ncbi:hypothetical protein L6Q21_02475 [Sandaracinobacter sp. RS1-74]|uniref:hypothetical protein n=1 Tax=Sandaracinobacteroides sayramensis TaxID=2913411 RepID=UPI001EDA7303|nr:hypothetical protein [Sandaracinobacteroides sayramensis]MCG2839847.1 hypothetical protein [Sandaracinobacteroides sayramensis]
MSPDRIEMAYAVREEVTPAFVRQPNIFSCDRPAGSRSRRRAPILSDGRTPSAQYGLR